MTTLRDEAPVRNGCANVCLGLYLVSRHTEYDNKSAKDKQVIPVLLWDRVLDDAYGKLDFPFCEQDRNCSICLSR